MKTKNNKQGSEHQARPPLEKDDLLNNNERRVIKILIEKPGLASYAEVHRSSSSAKGNDDKMPYDTVRDNIDRLEAGGYLKRGWTVNFKKIGYEIGYRIDVMIDPMNIEVEHYPESTIPINNPQQVLAAEILHLVEQAPFKNWVLIENIEILLGDPADLCITARVSSHKHIFDFVTRGLRSLKGIRQTSTCQIPWSVRDEPGMKPGDSVRCVSTILRQPAWEFSEFFPRLMVEKAG